MVTMPRPRLARSLPGDTTVVPKDTTRVVEAIRQLKVARDGALKARGAALVQLRDLMIRLCVPETRSRSCGPFVFMDKPAEDVASPHSPS
jgi:hypothetical protein